jgi:hypothetical protein
MLERVGCIKKATLVSLNSVGQSKWVRYPVGQSKRIRHKGNPVLSTVLIQLLENVAVDGYILKLN